MAFMYLGRDSSVGTATGYGLDGPEIESRWVARYSASVQKGTEAHAASYKIGIGPLSWGKAAWAWLWTSTFI
jgi:hypothetical protein